VFSQNTNSLSNSGNKNFYDAHTKIRNNNTTGKTSVLERHRLWLNMTNTQGAFKQLLIGYIEGATNGLDNDFDGISLDANPYVDFYSVNSGSNLVIQGLALPFSDVYEVQLGYRSAITGNFTISIDHADGLLVNQPVFLQDKHTNVVHDLRISGYTFATMAGTFKDRFILKYKNQSLDSHDLENKNNPVLVWTDDESINVSTSFQNIATIFVYTISGKLIYTDSPVSTNKINIVDVERNNQFLIMKIILDDNHIETRKIIY
jgi:hypothetical protein